MTNLRSVSVPFSFKSATFALTLIQCLPKFSTTTVRVSVRFQSLTSRLGVFRRDKPGNLATVPGSVGSTRPSWNSSSISTTTPHHLLPIPLFHHPPRHCPIAAWETRPLSQASTRHPTPAPSPARLHPGLRRKSDGIIATNVTNVTGETHRFQKIIRSGSNLRKSANLRTTFNRTVSRCEY